MITFQTCILLFKLNRIKNPVAFKKDTNNNSSTILSFSDLDYKIDEIDSIQYFKNETKNVKSYNIRLDELLHLEKEEYITISRDFYYDRIYLTHTGFRYIQIIILLFFKFIYRSILTPIAVAILTTIFWNYLFK